MARAPRPLDDLSDEEKRIFQTICTAADRYLEENDNGQYILSVDIELGVKPSPNVSNHIHQAYRNAGWDIVDFRGEGTTYLLTVSRPR